MGVSLDSKASNISPLAFAPVSNQHPVSTTTEPLAGSATCNRRSLFQLALSVAVAHVSGVQLTRPPPAVAVSGLQPLPPIAPLSNRYILLRAGDTKTLQSGRAVSHPIEHQSRDSQSLTARGRDQILSAAIAMKEQGVGEHAQLWVWPALTASSLESAEVVADVCEVIRENIVPEFSFLDPRGLGDLEGGPISDVRSRLREIDSALAKTEPTDDGTPNESVPDVFVRVRQLLSKLETQYFGADVILVGADSDTLATLENALCNRPLELIHDHEFAPGEFRIIEPTISDAA